MDDTIWYSLMSNTRKWVKYVFEISVQINILIVLILDECMC